MTVTYEDPAGLLRTLRSLEPLAREAASEVEVLVQNGGSGESIADSVAACSEWVSFSSLPDDGIYDAMNRGLARSTGRWIWFLNGGDESSPIDWAALRLILEDRSPQILAFGYDLVVGSREIRRWPRPGWYLMHALPTSHQAILFPGAVTRETRYDLSYQVAGDYALVASLRRKGMAYSPFRVSIARFQAGGLSYQRAREIARDADVAQRKILGLPLVVRLLSRSIHSISRTVLRVRYRWSGAESTLGQA